MRLYDITEATALTQQQQRPCIKWRRDVWLICFGRCRRVRVAVKRKPQNNPKTLALCWYFDCVSVRHTMFCHCQAERGSSALEKKRATATQFMECHFSRTFTRNGWTFVHQTSPTPLNYDDSCQGLGWMHAYRFRAMAFIVKYNIICSASAVWGRDSSCLCVLVLRTAIARIELCACVGWRRSPPIYRSN